MNEEPKIEDLNPLTSTTVNNEAKIDEVKPVPTVDNIEQVTLTSPNENIQPVEPATPVSTEIVEPVTEQPKPDVEVLDIDLNREKPTVVTEQVIDKVTEKKKESKASIVLVVVILLIVALAVIFIPQLSTLFK